MNSQREQDINAWPPPQANETDSDLLKKRVVAIVVVAIVVILVESCCRRRRRRCRSDRTDFQPRSGPWPQTSFGPIHVCSRRPSVVKRRPYSFRRSVGQKLGIISFLLLLLPLLLLVLLLLLLLLSFFFCLF